jgi:hypothetical protein
MATSLQLKRLQALIWVLIFGGLLTLVLGLSLGRYDQSAGLACVVVGGLLAAVGALLILLRARLKNEGDSPIKK